MNPRSEIVFGIRTILEAIGSGTSIEKIFIRKDALGEPYGEIIRQARLSDIPVQFVPLARMQRFTRKNHQGVVALVSPVEYQRIEDIVPLLFEQGKIPFILVFDGVTDIRNFGAMVRTAECAGVHAVLIPLKGGAAVNADAVKTSAGALFSMPVCRSPNMYHSLRFLKNSGLSIVGASEKSNLNYWQAGLTMPLALVMGDEGKGLSNDVVKQADQMIGLPVHGKISSLNVSASAAVLMYEVVRQRRQAEE